MRANKPDGANLGLEAQLWAAANAQHGSMSSNQSGESQPFEEKMARLTAQFKEHTSETRR